MNQQKPEPQPFDEFHAPDEQQQIEFLGLDAASNRNPRSFTVFSTYIAKHENIKLLNTARIPHLPAQ